MKKYIVLILLSLVVGGFIGTQKTFAEDKKCTDTDNGRNYNVKGYVYSTVGNTAPDSAWDGCMDDNNQSNEISNNGKVSQPAIGTKVVENYCDENDKYKSEVVKCDKGCFNGACRPCVGCVLVGYSCENNNECDTGKCKGGLCKRGFFQAIGYWFTNLF